MGLKTSHLISNQPHTNSRSMCIFLAQVYMLSIWHLIICYVEAMLNISNTAMCPHSIFFLFDPDGCFFVQAVNSVSEDESSQGPVILRKKRAAAKEKNTCQLFIQTDHFFFKYYGTREAVIAQVCTQCVHVT